MKGIIGAQIVKSVYGNYVLRVEFKDRETAEKVMRKLRIVGIFCQFKGEEE